MVRAAWAWTRVLGGVGILAFVLWRLGTGALLDSLHLLTGWTLAAALGIGALTTVFSAWRWCLVARGLGIDLPLRTAIADYYRALFVNAALPSGILGDVHRAVRNGRDSGDVGRGVRAVVLERFAGQVVLITFGLTVLLSHPALSRHVNLPRALVALIGVALVAAGVVLWVRRRGGASRIGRGLRAGLTDVRRGLLARNRWPLLVLASAIVVAGHLSMFVVAARAAGSHAPFLRLLPLMMLALFAMTLPVNIGGWGPREGVTAWAFGAAGLGATQGLTIAVLYGLFAFIAALPGVVVIVGQWAAKVTAARSSRGESATPTRQPAISEEFALVAAKAAAGALAPARLALIETAQVATAQAATAQAATAQAATAQAATAQAATAQAATAPGEMTLAGVALGTAPTGAVPAETTLAQTTLAQTTLAQMTLTETALAKTTLIGVTLTGAAPAKTTLAQMALAEAELDGTAPPEMADHAIDHRPANHATPDHATTDSAQTDLATADLAVRRRRVAEPALVG